ncbi:MAG TPA: DUF983 domain-containing protein [Cryomorphaceae bacterium]|nr:DUF983 domain-containing protein [Owenweeksia sp.]HAD97591.1 DUF983 domain-containing protein [Cryomorphaceae bacterium]HCQ14707.1 DUF983 domain-containing protein [Cryomorphaceae bacterium]|tara:strand:+ start:964 stop:1344 length:381 start_codon:yes stop_codon:yes gene_type:complete
MSQIASILKGECPCCHQAKVFEKTPGFSLFKIPKMRDTCKFCHYTFTREPGFFYGAMYVSYGLVVAEMLTTAVISRFVLNLGNFYTFLLMAACALLLSTVNYRMSRLIWMRLFIKKTGCDKARVTS